MLSAGQGGDFDVDGDTDDVDLALWSSGFGTQLGAQLIDGDDNVDGAVDGSDFLRCQQNYQPSSPLAAVPEPSSWVLLAAGTLVLGFRGKKTRNSSAI